VPPLEELPRAYLALLAEVAVLKTQIEWLRRQLFGGGKSEKRDRAQLLLKLDELEALANAAAPDAPPATTTVTYERTKPAPEKRPVPAETFAHLPVQETVVIEPPQVKAQPELYERIGEERTFEVDITPPKLFKRELVRPKYRLVENKAQPPVVAPALPRPVAGGYAAAGLLAFIALSKYVDHLPLYRLEQMSPRWGALISRQTMADWVRITSEWMEPIYHYLHRDLLKGGYVQVDETPIKYHDPDEKRGGTRHGFMWVMGKPGGDVVFIWRQSRRHEELTTVVTDDFKGVMQGDGYEAYAAYQRAHPGVVLVGCWAHARRKFFEAQAENPKAGRVALKLIGRLYAWERIWDTAKVTEPAERARLRAAHFARPLRWLRALALKLRERVLPAALLGKACTYLLNQWEPLTAHVQHGQTRIDNNLIENAIRPSAIGKKNWLFIGHPEAGQRSAIIYSLVVSCQRHGKDPHAYLRDVLSRLPKMTNQDDLGPLTPARWTAPIEVVATT